MSTDLVFRALSDPGRRALLDAMREEDRSVTELTTVLPISQPALSQHLRVLDDAGLVSVRQVGRQRRYRADPEGFREAARWLDRYGRFWDERLDALSRHLDEEGS